MSTHYYIISVLLLFFFSCQDKVETVIPQETLVKILADIHLSEAATQTLQHKQKDSTLAKYYQQVMDIHQVLRADFDSSMVILKENPKLMLSVYEQVMEEIDKERAALD